MMIRNGKQNHVTGVIVPQDDKEGAFFLSSLNQDKEQKRDKIQDTNNGKLLSNKGIVYFLITSAKKVLQCQY